MIGSASLDIKNCSSYMRYTKNINFGTELEKYEIGKVIQVILKSSYLEKAKQCK